MLTAKAQKKKKTRTHSSDGYNSVMCELGKWNWGDGFRECHISVGHAEASVASCTTGPAEGKMENAP